MIADWKARWRTRLAAALLIVCLPLLVPALLLWLLIVFVGKLLLLIAVWAFWIPRGKDMLLVYSRSPHWVEYFESGLIRELEGRAMILNWSDRAQWSSLDLRILIFKAFKGAKSFNPMVIVFKPLRWPVSFRFYDAFKLRKHGNDQQLHELEAKLAAHLANT